MHPKQYRELFVKLKIHCLQNKPDLHREYKGIKISFLKLRTYFKRIFYGYRRNFLSSPKPKTIV
jgi:hypothetical protein